MISIKPILVLTALATTAIQTVQATIIELELGPSQTLSYDTSVLFEDLNGTPLTGQNLSVDFTFADNAFVRLFSVTTTYGTSLLLHTDGAGLVGYLDGTGYLLDANRQALHTPQYLGAASSSDAWMCADLFPLWSGEVQAPFDGYGVHYDLTLPNNPLVKVTGAELRLSAYGGEGPFGIGPGVPINLVPDTGETMLLLGLSLAMIVTANARLRAMPVLAPVRRPSPLA
jgi:hypothetical protein